jgi:hypothetical protein
VVGEKPRTLKNAFWKTFSRRRKRLRHFPWHRRKAAKRAEERAIDPASSKKWKTSG